MRCREQSCLPIVRTNAFIISRASFPGFHNVCVNVMRIIGIGRQGALLSIT